jgi:hypothetical protein
LLPSRSYITHNGLRHLFRDHTRRPSGSEKKRKLIQPRRHERKKNTQKNRNSPPGREPSKETSLQTRRPCALPTRRPCMLPINRLHKKYGGKDKTDSSVFVVIRFIALPQKVRSQQLHQQGCGRVHLDSPRTRCRTEPWKLL